MKIDIDTMTLEDVKTIEVDFAKNFDSFWSIAILKEDMQDTNSVYLMAKSENELLGFIGIKIVLDNADIMNIVVKKEKRNLGIGSLLMEKAIVLVKQHNCQAIFLEVNEKNLPAISLYQKFLFEKVYTREKYYHHTDNAIIMKKSLI